MIEQVQAVGVFVMGMGLGGLIVSIGWWARCRRLIVYGGVLIAERQQIDRLLSGRPALDPFHTRFLKIEHALATAKQADEWKAKYDRLLRESALRAQKGDLC